MARKTIEVEKVKGIANRALEASMRWNETDNKYVPVDRYWRQGVMLMVEQVLMESNNYKGFRYLALDEVPKGAIPGIRRDRGQEQQFENTDSTRVRYF
tara:strand:+ start:313 stop:606 length:294 start_codon:yes stop_codon:yes gene_type:complete